MNHLSAVVASLTATLLSTGAFAATKLKSKGELRLESRVFSNDHLDATKDYGLGFFGRLEASLKHKPFSERVRIFGRLDQQDPNRTIFVVEELWIEAKKWGFSLRVGADIVNWSATEAFHPADILNARNLDSDAENYEKVGEPMVSLRYQLGQGSITAYFMPYYSVPILPAASSRLSFIPVGVTLGPVLRLEQNGELVDGDFGLQGAVRITQNIGDADVGLHVVHHMDRFQPEVVFDPETFMVRPLFRKVTQFGGTYQHALGPVVAKVEAGYRYFAEPDGGMTRYGPLGDRNHLQVAAGLEYGFLHESGVESTFILEGQSIFLVDEEVRRALQIFQRDALFGYRMALNDESSTEALISMIMDLEDPENVLFNASFSRRVFDTWSVSAALRLVFAPTNSTNSGGISVPAASDHFRLFLTRYF